MELLISKQEVAEMAFEGTYGITADRIGETIIISAQQKFIKPVLGKLYGRIEGGRYTELLEMIKPALAHYVKMLMIPQLAVSVGNGGITSIKSSSFNSADDGKIKAFSDIVRSEACALMRSVVEYIEQNQNKYPEYDPNDNVLNKVSICSGIIL